jgi:hypothetical protein
MSAVWDEIEPGPGMLDVGDKLGRAPAGDGEEGSAKAGDRLLNFI